MESHKVKGINRQHNAIKNVIKQKKELWKTYVGNKTESNYVRHKKQRIRVKEVVKEGMKK